MCIPLSYRCDDEFDCGEDMDGNNDDSDQQGCGMPHIQINSSILEG